MSRRRSRGGKRRRGNSRNRGKAPAIVALTLVALASSALIGGYAWLKVRSLDNVVLDPETNCPLDGPTSVTAFLFDTTDAIPEASFMHLRNTYERVIGGEIEVGGEIWVGSITDKPGELIVGFRGCNPGDASTVDDWTENRRMRLEKFQRGYREPLEAALDRIKHSQGADQSPIMAAIQSVKLQIFETPEARDVPKRLVVASDMIEHTDLYSQYRSGADYQAYLNSPASSPNRTDLMGAEVTVLYFNRPQKKFGSAPHAQFWANWFADNRSGKFNFVKVEGI